MTATGTTTAPLHAAFSNRLESTASSPSPELQYMPPGRHRIRASQGGKPLSHCLPRDCGFARQGIARMRLRATLTGESDLRLFSAVGVRRVSILGTVLDRMLTKSA